MAPDRVFADQRVRLREAMIEMVAERGLDGVTVRGLASRAAVSTRTFYRHFANLRECLGQVYEATMLAVLRRTKAGIADDQSQEAKIQATVALLMEEFAAKPEATHLALVDAYAEAPSMRARMNVVHAAYERELLSPLAKIANPAPHAPPALGPLVAGLLRVVRTTSMAGRAEELPACAEDLANWLEPRLRLEHRETCSAAPPPAQRLNAGLRSLSAASAPSGAKPFGDETVRLYRAAIRLAGAKGAGAPTVYEIRTLAGVSRRAFDTHFANATACLLEAIEWMVTTASARAQAWATNGADDAQVHRLVQALCAQAARNRSLAKLILLDILDAGRPGLLRREHFVTLAAAHLQQASPGAGTSGALAAEASVAAAWRLAEAEVEAGRGALLAERAEELSALLAA